MKVTKDELKIELRRIKSTHEDEVIGHSLADQALLDYIGDDEVKELFDVIDKAY